MSTAPSSQQTQESSQATVSSRTANREQSRIPLTQPEVAGCSHALPSIRTAKSRCSPPCTAEPASTWTCDPGRPRSGAAHAPARDEHGVCAGQCVGAPVRVRSREAGQQERVQQGSMSACAREQQGKF